MCTSRFWGRFFGSPKPKQEPFLPNAYEQLTIPLPDEGSKVPPLEDRAHFTLTCESRGVVLTKTFKLPYKWLTSEAGELICEGFASALIKDVGLLEKSRLENAES